VIDRYIDAPRSQTWEVLSDLGGWGELAPNLSKTEVVDGAAQGAVRRCYDNAGKSWRETCTLWQPGRRYVMDVDTSDYPYPITLMRGTFSVDDEGSGTRVRLQFDYRFKYGPLGRLAGILARPMFARTCRRLLKRIEAESISRAPSVLRPTYRAHGAKCVPGRLASVWGSAAGCAHSECRDSRRQSSIAQSGRSPATRRRSRATGGRSASVPARVRKTEVI
jgi:hypothetical protein